MKKSTTKMKTFWKAVAVFTAILTAAGAIFGVVGALKNKELNEKNTENINRLKETLRNNAKFDAESIVNNNKKTPAERAVITNPVYANYKSVVIGNDFFPYINRTEYADLNNYYNLTVHKDIKIFIDPNMDQANKSLVRESINYLHTIFHTIDSNITIKETDHLIESPTCIHVKDNLTKTSDDIIGQTHLSAPTDEEYLDAIDVEIFVNSFGSNLNHNEDFYKATYKSIVTHEICHALGIPHISEMMDSINRFGNQINAFNDLNRPLMSRYIDSTPNDFFTANEIAGLFGMINRVKYLDLNNKTDKTELENRLVEDFNKYINLIEYSLTQSRGYKLNNNGSEVMPATNQVIRLNYTDTEYNSQTSSNMDANITLTFNYPYVGYYQKEIAFEDGSSKTFSAPFFTTRDNEGKYKYSLLSEDLLHFSDVNVYEKSVNATLVASDLTASQVMENIKTLDPEKGYYVIENGHEYKTYIYQTQNFWQEFLKKYQDNKIYYESPLFVLYETTPAWHIENSQGKVVIANDVTNKLQKSENTDLNFEEPTKEWLWRQ